MPCGAAPFLVPFISILGAHTGLTKCPDLRTLIGGGEEEKEGGREGGGESQRESTWCDLLPLAELNHELLRQPGRAV